MASYRLGPMLPRQDQTMCHNVDYCPLTKLDGSVSDFTLQIMMQSSGWQTLEGEPAYEKSDIPLQSTCLTSLLFSRPSMLHHSYPSVPDCVTFVLLRAC